MDTIKFLQTYQQLQYSIMGDILINLKSASITLNTIDSSTFWNYALLKNSIVQNDLKEIEGVMHEYKRSPTLYFDANLRDNLDSLLSSHSYSKNFEDSWMFHSGEISDASVLNDIRIVNNENGLQEFLTTFDQCYREDDPQNPYGELGTYLKVAEKVWKLHKDTGRLEYIMIYNNNEPVGVATLTNFAGIGYISNVGSLLKVRGNGFGKAVSLFAVSKSVKNKNELHCLATEAGHYPYEFYKRIGFTPKFTALGYSKSLLNK
jgi:hypothetical protein